MKHIYVGLIDGRKEVIRPDVHPTRATHGHIYAAVIGPFKTVRGAKFMASDAAIGNPHVLTSRDADRIARELSQVIDRR